MSANNFFTRRPVVFALATLCCLLWGSAYPAIKNGYTLLHIAANDIPGKLLFAGWRFLFAGLVLLVFARFTGKSLRLKSLRETGEVCLLGLTQTSLQYVFFYLGLAYTTGVKGSIMNGTGTFFSVLLAHFIYHNDRLSAPRITGCLVGFVGVLVVNFSPELIDFNFALAGEGSVVLAAFILSAASIYGKRLSQHIDSVVLTGWQLGIGGLALLVAGWGTGGQLESFSLAATALMAYMVLLSSVAFALWTILLKYNRVGIVTVFNFLIPVFGAGLSALFLDESIFELKNLLALVLVCGGIWLVTREASPDKVLQKPA
ncbi:DMT family transporter [Uliginosibacterium sp. 31-16]|uniref:DMT family transporter n=1 Tax=Uliginosibacterium sp. 31-16 TaxID=3068315 RepID=UPI00273E5195|nr:DMT family transporter [Uliginosibacterium sp. 31-16]MDP5240487.1 DMT family transporter [Uliginosibacterium sp. 31-16]